MDKKQVKQIEITEVKVNRLSCSPDITGEYSTTCDVDFMLSTPITFHVFNIKHTIDRIKMDMAWDETQLLYANEKNDYRAFPVTKALIHKVYDRVRLEQLDGCLKGWCFDDDIFDMLTGKRESWSMW